MISKEKFQESVFVNIPTFTLPVKSNTLSYQYPIITLVGQ